MTQLFTALLLVAALLATARHPRARLKTTTGTSTSPRAGPSTVDELALADDIDLFALCLAAGLPMADATRAVATAAHPTTTDHWARVASVLNIGFPADRAFAEVEHLTGFDDLARLIRRSTHSGSAIAGGCHDLAARFRSQAADQAVARAERAGVFIALPLSGCFLPAFVVLGLAPVVISLGSDLLTR